MNAHQFEALHPKEYQRRFLREKVRVCGRDFDSVRSTLVSTGVVKSEDGSALVKMGNTTVLCGLKLEVGRAGHMNPKEGRIEVEVGFPSDYEELFDDYVEMKDSTKSHQEQVFPYVPVQIVTNVIAKHGGMVEGEVPNGVAPLKASNR